jgi:hypothetical protein
MPTSWCVKLITILAIGALVGGCGARVRTDVSRFSSLALQVGATFIVVPLDAQRGSAEYDVHARSLVRRLQQQGLQQAENPASADYAVLFNYGMAGSRIVSGAVPLWGQTGGGTSYQSGTVSAFGSGGSAIGSYSGTTYTAPTYGVVGMVPYSYQQHSRFLLIRMIDLKRSSKDNLVAAWEAQATSTGSASSFAPVAECMFDAIFKNFRATGSERVTDDRDSCGK